MNSTATSHTLVNLDVRDDLRQGREPFSRIMSAVAALRADQQLLLVAPFEPAPLIQLLQNRGFAHTARPLGGGDWEVLFALGDRPPVSEAPPQAVGPSAITSIVEVDARGLEPPQPLIKILEALAALPPGARLRARTAQWPGACTWDRLVKGPEEFRVKITKLKSLAPVPGPAASCCGGH